MISHCDYHLHFSDGQGWQALFHMIITCNFFFLKNQILYLKLFSKTNVIAEHPKNS